MIHKPSRLTPHHVLRGVELAEAIVVVLLLAAVLIAGLVQLAVIVR